MIRRIYVAVTGANEAWAGHTGPGRGNPAGEEAGQFQANCEVLLHCCPGLAASLPLSRGSMGRGKVGGHFEGSPAHRPHQAHFTLTGAPVYVALQAAHACSPTYTREAASTSISHKRIPRPTAAVHPGSQKLTRRTELGLSQQPRVIKEPRPACSGLGESGGPLPAFAVASFRSEEMPASGFPPFFFSLKYSRFTTLGWFLVYSSAVQLDVCIHVLSVFFLITVSRGLFRVSPRILNVVPCAAR